MRCLFCDKKLSLLKMAKGDSFCSPAHFDAYQLQSSKIAFERLKSLQADEDAPKTPLVVKPAEETAPEPAAHAPAPIPQLAALKPPPYAAFASSKIAPSAPSAPAPVPHGPDDSPRELAYPAHQVDAAEGLLNLHLELQFAQVFPADWTPERTSAPLDFRPERRHPPARFQPEFPEPEQEEQPPAPPAAAPEFQVAQAAPNVVPDVVPHVEPNVVPDVVPHVVPHAVPHAVPNVVRRVPYHVAPSFRERAGATAFLDAAGSLAQAAAPKLVLSQAAHFEPTAAAIAASSRFTGAEPPAPKNAHLGWMEGTRAVATPAASVLAPAARAIPGAKYQVSGAITPASNPFEGERASAVLAPFTPLSVPGKAPLARRLGGAGELAGQPLASIALLVQKGAPVSIAPAPGPRKPGPAPVIGPAILPLDRPGAPTAPLYPRELSAAPGRSAAFAEPADANIESAWPTAPTPLPAPRPLWSCAPRRRTTPFWPAFAIADSTATNAFVLETLPGSRSSRFYPCASLATRSFVRPPFYETGWTGSDFALPPTPRPEPGFDAGGPRLAEAPALPSREAAAETGLFPVAPERAFAAAPSMVAAEPGLPYSPKTRVLEIADYPSGRVEMTRCPAWDGWERRSSPLPARPDPRLLPFRQGPILPQARSWPRLAPLPA